MLGTILQYLALYVLSGLGAFAILVIVNLKAQQPPAAAVAGIIFASAFATCVVIGAVVSEYL